ncbi:MAG: extracellular solute-binding protein [Spirochaetaceae bacterium]|jgi:raffinose/stachyose/melibiose transport system substrate-binding protein|nr:extracellular solute-binding protein [Spirochaetaceae bacterium]
MKKKILIIPLILALGMALYAGGGSQSSSGGAGSAKKPVVTVLIQTDTVFDGPEAVFNAAAEKFGFDLQVEIRPIGGEGDNVIKTRLATGDMADLFLYNTGSLLQAINPERNIVDLTNEPWMAPVTDSFKTAASVNGRVYAIPFGSTQAGAWLYNKRVYRELGLQVPRTWKDLLANLDKAQAAGKIAIIGSYKDTWTSQLIVLADEYNVKAALPNYPADYTANRLKIATTPAALRSFEKLWETRKYLNKDALATTFAQGIEMIATGQGVHYPMLSAALKNIEGDYPEYVNDIGVFGQPGDDPNNHGLTVWESGGWYIYRNSPNIELCKKILEFYISQEGIDIYGSKLKAVGPYSVKGIKLPANVYPAVLEMQPYFDAGKTAPALEFESPVKGPNLEQFCVEVGTGITEPRTAAAAYDADVQKQAVQLNLPGW